MGCIKVIAAYTYMFTEISVNEPEMLLMHPFQIENKIIKHCCMNQSQKCGEDSAIFKTIYNEMFSQTNKWSTNK